MVVTREYVDVPVEGRAMRAFLTRPRAAGRWPGIVFYSDIFQLTESTLRWCVRLAGYGYAVLAPEIYHRREPAGTVLGFDDAGKARGQADADATPVAEFDADIDAAIAYLQAREDISTVGAAGHCTGGHLAFRAALRESVRGTVCWYPTGLHDGKLGQDADAGTLARTGEISGGLLLIWGARDPHTPLEGREQVRAGLEATGTHASWSEYDCEHAFGRDVGDRYDPAATDRAFAETVAFLRRSLGS